MKDVYQTSMTDLYSTTSFGGGGGSGRGSSRKSRSYNRRTRGYGGPGGGSDPGNAGGLNAPSRGPLSDRQRTAVRVAGLAVAASPARYPVRFAGGLVSMFGGGRN